MIYKKMIKDATEASNKVKPLSKKQLASMLCEICPDLEANDLMRLKVRNLQLLLGLMR
jgi:hypothetical protein